jgi:hypothetical protein
MRVDIHNHKIEGVGNRMIACPLQNAIVIVHDTHVNTNANNKQGDHVLQ